MNYHGLEELNRYSTVSMIFARSSDHLKHLFPSKFFIKFVFVFVVYVLLVSQYKCYNERKRL